MGTWAAAPMTSGQRVGKSAARRPQEPAACCRLTPVLAGIDRCRWRRHEWTFFIYFFCNKALVAACSCNKALVAITRKHDRMLLCNKAHVAGCSRNKALVAIMRLHDQTDCKISRLVTRSIFLKRSATMGSTHILFSFMSCLYIFFSISLPTFFPLNVLQG